MDTEQAIEMAIQFLEQKAGFTLHKLKKVRLNKNQKEWRLQFDVGLFWSELVDITLDDETGRVTHYESPK